MADIVDVARSNTLLDSIIGPKAFSNSSPLNVYYANQSDTFFGNNPLTLRGSTGNRTDFLWDTEADIAYASIALVSGLSFNFVTSGGSADLQLFGAGNLFDDSGVDINGQFFFPESLTLNGSPAGLSYGNFETTDPALTTDAFTGSGSFRQRVVLHEIGHGIGLRHGYEDTEGANGFSLDGTPLSDERYTPLSRQSEAATDVAAFGHAVSYMALDIAAIQHIYGVNNSAHLGNTSYALTGGSSSVPLDIDGSDDTISVGRAYYSIWDSGGSDTIEYSVGSRDVVINLNTATLNTALDPTSDLASLLDEVSNSAAFAALDADVQIRMTDAAYHAGGFLSQAINSDGTAADGGYTIANGAEVENATGGSGDDLLIGNALGNRLIGNDGSDSLFGGGGRDFISGGSGSDGLHGGDKGDFLYGNRGTDFINPGAGVDLVDGGLGFDRVWYGDSNGGVTVDLLNGSGARNNAAGDTYSGIERVTGSAFSDSVVGNELSNSIKTGDGDDIVYGRGGRDVIEGQGGRDSLYGGSSNDNILGGIDNDKLFGNSGFDKLFGGLGNDQLTGGADTDFFVFETQGTSGFGGDIVFDFQDGTDRLDVRGVYSVSDANQTAAQFSDFTISSHSLGVQIRFEAGQIIYLDDSLNGITVADVDSGDFVFA